MARIRCAGPPNLCMQPTACGPRLIPSISRLMATHLMLGFFEDFKGSDAVLLSGSGGDIRDLAQRLRDFASSSNAALPIHDIASVSPEHPARLFTVRSPLTSPAANQLTFHWSCSPSEIEAVSSKLLALVEGPSGHQYFDLVGSDVQLIISVGEYDALWSRRDG